MTRSIRQIIKPALIALAGAALLLAFGSGAQAQEGAQLYQTKGCVACHGPEGAQPIQPNYAILAGQQAPYLVAQLQAFKAQERTSAQSSLMWGMASQLTEDDMQKIAEYLSSVGGGVGN